METISRSKTIHKSTSNLIGVLWALCGVGLFALIYVSGKLSDTNATALQIMWLRYVGGFLTMVTLLFVRRGVSWGVSTSQPVLLHVARAGAGGFGGVAAVYAAGNMPVASATAIGLLDGLFTVALGMMVLREKVGLRQWAATFVCLSGAGIIVGSQGAFSTSNLQYTLPALVALAGAVLVATESILIKTLVRSEPAMTVLLYVNFFGCILLAGPGIASWMTLDAFWIIGFLLLGPIAIVAQYCNLRAFRAAPASVIGTIRYAWIVYSAIFGVLLFGEPISRYTAAGIGLILMGGSWLALSRHRH